MNRTWTAVLILALVFALPAGATGQEDGSGFGVAAGLLLPGTIDVDGFEVDSETSMMLRLTYDSFQIPTLGFGAFINYSNVGVEGETGTMTTFGVAIKPRWRMGSSGDQFLDVGLNIGYRTVTNDYLTDDITGLAVNLSAEYIKPFSDTMNLMFDFGFITQPSGGNEASEVTWGPIFYLMAGLAF